MPENLELIGIHVALLTAFGSDGSIDYNAFRNHARYLSDKVNGFVVGGTTGEGMYLSSEQVVDLLRVTTHLKNSNTSVIGGVIKHTSEESLEQVQAIDNAKSRHQIGIDAILVAPPINSNYNYSEAEAFYIKALEHTGLPILAYNIPSRTGYTFTAGQLFKLHEKTEGNVIGVKDSSDTTDLAKGFVDIIKMHGNDMPLTFLQGNDRYLQESLTILRDGGYKKYLASISGASNFLAYAELEGIIISSVRHKMDTLASNIQKYLNTEGLGILRLASKYNGEPPILKVLVNEGDISYYPTYVSKGLKTPTDKDQYLIRNAANSIIAKKDSLLQR